MKVCQSEFVACATQLGVITPLPPVQEHYLGVGSMGALMAERFYDARSKLLERDPHLICRDPKFILFSKRKEAFMKHAYLRDYVSQTYPRLLPFLTDKQYEQINWINTTHQTNERLPNPSALAFQQQRIFARLHFLDLLRQGGLEAHQHFVWGQNEPQLTVAPSVRIVVASLN